MILKLKSFFLQNGGSYLSLPNTFELKNKNSIEKKKNNLIKKSFKEIQSESIETILSKKKHLIKNNKMTYLATKYSEFELRKKELKYLPKKKRSEIECNLLDRPIKKIKQI